MYTGIRSDASLLVIFVVAIFSVSSSNVAFTVLNCCKVDPEGEVYAPSVFKCWFGSILLMTRTVELLLEVREREEGGC